MSLLRLFDFQMAHVMTYYTLCQSTEMLALTRNMILRNKVYKLTQDQKSPRPQLSIHLKANLNAMDTI